MNRLTEHREAPLVMSMWGGSSEALRIYNRLAAYENTGLEPEEIRVLQEEHEFYNKEDVPTSQRLIELAIADKEGRCVVLPCKEGDTVILEHEKTLLQERLAKSRRREMAAIKDLVTTHKHGLCEVCGRAPECLMSLNHGNGAEEGTVCDGGKFEWCGLADEKGGLT